MKAVSVTGYYMGYSVNVVLCSDMVVGRKHLDQQPEGAGAGRSVSALCVVQIKSLFYDVLDLKCILM